MKRSDLFLGGVPTEPDVRKLVEIYGVPKVGDEFPYQQIADALGVPIKSYRFRTVTWAWRKLLDRQHNLIVGAVQARGFVVLDNQQRVTFSAVRFKRGLKAVRRGSCVASRTDTAGLTPEERRSRDHIVATGSMLQLAAATEARKLKLTFDNKESIR